MENIIFAVLIGLVFVVLMCFAGLILALKGLALAIKGSDFRNLEPVPVPVSRENEVEQQLSVLRVNGDGEVSRRNSLEIIKRDILDFESENKAELYEWPDRQAG